MKSKDPSMELFEWQCSLHGIEESQKFAQVLSGLSRPPLLIALDGTLGSGKTTWTRFFATCCGVLEEQVTSPTFVLVHKYDGTPTLFHLDAYRIRDEDEFLELGVEEMFESDSIVIVEWASRVKDCLPDNRLEIYFEVLSEDSRSVRVLGRGTVWELAESFRKKWKESNGSNA